MRAQQADAYSSLFTFGAATPIISQKIGMYAAPNSVYQPGANKKA